MISKSYYRLRTIKALLPVYIEACGLNFKAMMTRMKSLPRYYHEYNVMKQQAEDNQVVLYPSYPILHDYGDSAGTATGHYFHQDIWAARKVYQANPVRHVDIGSRVDGFVSHLMVFRPIEVVDIRPLVATAENLSFVQADATNLENFADNSLQSLSSLHAAEHFGLGRYGDPLDINAHFKFMKAMQRVLAPEGRLYFSVPIGRERIEFNAHRIISPLTILNQFSDLKLVSFSAVNDAGDFVKDCQPHDFVNAEFSCGLFEFTK